VFWFWFGAEQVSLWSKRRRNHPFVNLYSKRAWKLRSRVSTETLLSSECKLKNWKCLVLIVFAMRNEWWMHRPTAENLVPIRLDIEIEGQRYKDAFTWNPSGNFEQNLFIMLFLFLHLRWLNSDIIDPDSEVVVFAKRTVKDLKLPPAFVTQIAQSIQVHKSPFLYPFLYITFNFSFTIF